MNYYKVDQEQVEVLRSLCTIINDWAEKKGWNGQPDTQERRMSQIALMHSELSECVEFLRKKPWNICPVHGHVQIKIDTEGAHASGLAYCTICNLRTTEQPVPDDHVPSLTGEAAELADVLIRIFHYCGEHSIDLGEAVRLKHEYNITRPFRHGKTI